MKRSRTLIFAAVAATSLVAAAPAMAEGTFSSSLTRVLTGFDSRTWYDGARDSVATTIRLDRCTNYSTGGRATTATLQLTRERGGILPDENRGQKDFACQVSATGNWGTQPASNYHFTVTKIAGSESGGSLNASAVVVSY